MASVKREQILLEAEKLATRGKLDAAIKEYRRALEGAPHDTNTLNRLGDLLVRVSQIPEAIEVYDRIAAHFSQDGFFLKAIAIYKKVNRLDPQRTATYEHLGDLYFKQGLTVEGRQQFATLADWFMRSKQVDQAVRVFRRLIELEPANLQARGKLVDLLVQSGDVAAVSTEIDSLGRSLLARNMLEEAVKLYHRALELQPAHGDFVAPCVDALVGAGRASQAVELAERALKATKGGIELRRAAARAAAEAGDLKRARHFLEALLPEVGDRTDVVQLYGDVMLRVGESEAAKEHLLPTIDRLAKAGDFGRARALVKRLLRSAPGDPEVLERAAKVFDRREDPDLVESIEASLADAYLRIGKRSEAASLYASLAERSPDNQLFADRALELGVAPRPTPASSEPSRTRERESGSRPAVVTAISPGPADEAPPTDVEIVDIDVPWDDGPVPTAFSAGEQGVQAESDTGRIPPATESVSSQFETAAGEPAAHVAPPSAADELLTEAQVFAKYGLVDKAIVHLQKLLSLDPEHEAGRELLRSLGGGVLTEFDASPLPADGDVPSAATVDPWAGEVPTGVPVALSPDQVLPIEFDVEFSSAPLVEPPEPVAQAGVATKPGIATKPDVVTEPGTDAGGVTPIEVVSASDAAFSGVVGEFADESAIGLPGVTDESEVRAEAEVTPSAVPLESALTKLTGEDVQGLFETESERALIPGIPVEPTESEAIRPVRSRPPSIRIDDLEAMLGLGGVPPVEPRLRHATPAPEFELDLGQLGVTPGAPAVAGRPGSVQAAAPDQLVPAAMSTESVEPPRSQPSGSVAQPKEVPARPIAVPVGSVEANQVEPSEEPIELVEVAEVLAGPEADQLGEVDFFLQQGLLDDAAKMLERLRSSFGEHPEVKSRLALLKARGWDEEHAAAPSASAASELFSEEEQFFDLAAELEKELAEDELVAQATGAGQGNEASIEDLFREFQRGVAEQVQEEDFDTHFNLGLAYREMGLLDEAIGEFQLSLRSAEYFIDSTTMIGACYIEKGLPEQAGEWYARALTAPVISPETAVALRYELGRAHESAGKIVEALACYTEVLALNPGFRDVVSRVSSLRAN